MERCDPSSTPTSSETPNKRRRIVQNTSHRSNNACRRCKAKKAKCEFDDGGALGLRCRACTKADAECIFDISVDGIPGGVAYTAALEERVAFLERELQQRDGVSDVPSSHNADQALANSSQYFQGAGQDALDRTSSQGLNSVHYNPVATTSHQKQKSEQQPGRSTSVTVFTLLQTASNGTIAEPPELPDTQTADALFQSAWLHTQARYCLVDWAKVSAWHKQYILIFSTSLGGDTSSKVGAFFLWIIYAIGARLIPSTKQLSPIYYNQAIANLQAVLDSSSLLTIQALLALTQYNCRATSGPSPWHLIGVALRLCVEHGYHRQTNDPSLGSYEREARKRAFWSTYLFDRMIATALQRPFGLDDLDIDVEEPLNVDVSCTDPAILDGMSTEGSSHLTSMSFAIHHLHIYQLKSRIARYTKPLAQGPSTDEILQLLGELDDWKQAVPPRTSEKSIPQQHEDRTQAMYLQTALQLIRSVLCRDGIYTDLISRFASIAADACENGRALSQAQSHTSAVQMYNSFYCGIALLQCLAIKPDALPLRRILRAIKACSNTLAVYSSSLEAAVTLAQLFDKLSEQRFSDADSSALQSGSQTGISFLRQVALSDPSQAERLLSAIPDDEDIPVDGLETTESLLSLTGPLGPTSWLNWEEPLASFEFDDLLE